MAGVTLMVMKIWSDDWMVITLEKAQIFSPEFLNSPGSPEQSTSGVGELVVDGLLDEVGFWVNMDDYFESLNKHGYFQYIFPSHHLPSHRYK